MKLPVYISEIIMRLKKNGFSAFAVGGCVRDTILGISPKDWDICTAAQPADVLKIFEDFKTIPTGIKHGTVTVLTPGGAAEITTFRSDGKYSDNRHPQSITFLTDIEDDLSRRDFTINAMAYSDDTNIIDLFGGKSDLKNRILRTVGDPEIRFSEDALRILRALRFASVYNLSIENNTAFAIHKCRTHLAAISAERITSELRLMLESESPGKLLRNYQDVFSVIMSQNFETDNYNWNRCTEIMDKLPPFFYLRLSAMFYFIKLSGNCISDKDYCMQCKTILKNMRLDNITIHDTTDIIKLQCTSLPSSLADARRLLGRVGSKIYQAIIEFKSFAGDTDKHLITAAKEYYNNIIENNLCCKISDLDISGSDLVCAGVPQGKDVGDTLRKLLELVIEEKLANEKNILLNFVFSSI